MSEAAMSVDSDPSVGDEGVYEVQKVVDVMWSSEVIFF